MPMCFSVFSLTRSRCHVKRVSPENRFSNSCSPSNNPLKRMRKSKTEKRTEKPSEMRTEKKAETMKMQVYTGKPSGRCPERNQGLRVVLDVTEGLHGRNVTCDNYFTSYKLAWQLLERKITVVGTVWKNKPELPTGLLVVKGREVFFSRFAFTPTATLVSYIPKKNRNVVLLSMRHAEADSSDRKDGKPVIVLDYNRNKGGVDNLDKVIGMYSCRRMTARWPLVIFHNILDVSSYNAFVIWREINPDWMPGKRNMRRVFLEQLGKALMTLFIARRKRIPRTEASAVVVKAVKAAAAARRALDHDDDTRPERPASSLALVAATAAPLGVGKRKRCQICPRKKDCKTHTVCRGCNKYICKGCSLVYCPTCAC